MSYELPPVQEVYVSSSYEKLVDALGAYLDKLDSNVVDSICIDPEYFIRQLLEDVYSKRVKIKE